MTKQVEAVRTALAAPDPEITVKPTLCFVNGEWSLFAKPFVLDGVWIGWPKALRERLLSDGPLSSELVASIARRVAVTLPAA
jgi:hypothetical protein